MKKELTSFEIAYRIVREVCGGSGSQKKRRKRARSLAKMVETDIDIFADENKKSSLEIQGEIYDRFRHEDKEHKCGDCGAVAGEYHHQNCDMERCPKCKCQLISCDCEDINLMDE